MSNSTCTIDGCGRAHNARGLCVPHYKRWQKYGDPQANAPRADPVCAIKDCGLPTCARGWCRLHYYRWKRHGDPNHVTIRVRNVCTIDGCGEIVLARGWCLRHYNRWKRRGDPLARQNGEIRNGKRICPRCRDDLPLAEYSPGGGFCRFCLAKTKREKPLPERVSNPTVFCVECGTPFVPKLRTSVACSDRCRARRNTRFARQDNVRRQKRMSAAYVEDVDYGFVYERDLWVCGLCRESIDMSISWPDPKSPSIDHIVPINRGGLHSYTNCQAAHLGCNVRKSDHYIG